MQKKWIVSGFSAMCWLFLVGTVWPVLAEKAGTPQDNVAVVNGVTITRADFDREMNRAKQVYGMGKPIQASQLPEIERKTLENLVEREVLFQESEKRGIKVDESVVNNELDKLKKRFPSEEEFKQNLERMDLTEASLKSEFKRVMAVQQLIEEQIVVNVAVSEKEVDSYYTNNPNLFKQPEQVRASHILIGVKSDANESEKAEARKKTESVLSRLKKGEKFEALAKEFSTCPSNTKGGDLGFFRRGQMVKPFENAAFSLEPGQTSDIVETRFGYHVIRVVEKKPASTLALADVKEQLEQQIKQQKIRSEMGKYVADLKEKAKVERFLSNNK
jgi:peptidyl-prolyl cis-trans isomerase C